MPDFPQPLPQTGLSPEYLRNGLEREYLRDRAALTYYELRIARHAQMGTLTEYTAKQATEEAFNVGNAFIQARSNRGGEEQPAPEPGSPQQQ